MDTAYHAAIVELAKLILIIHNNSVQKNLITLVAGEALGIEKGSLGEIYGQ
jgi:hypothetical protein